MGSRVCVSLGIWEEGMERQSRKICHSLYLYCSRPSGPVPNCYCGLKSFTSFCFHWRSTLRMGDKYCEQAKILSSFFPLPVLRVCSRVRGKKRGASRTRDSIVWWVTFFFVNPSVESYLFTYLLLLMNEIFCLEKPWTMFGEKTWIGCVNRCCGYSWRNLDYL